MRPHADVLRRRAFTAFLWSYGGYMGGRVAVFATTLVLARLLAPDDFGLIAFALAILAYLDSVKDGGVSEAIVYREDANRPAVASTAFWLTIATTALLVAAAWFFAPLLGELDSDESAVWIFRVLALQLVLGSLGVTHRALLYHRLAFRRVFVTELLAALAKAAVSVGLAFAGFGVWSLVWGQLAGAIAALAATWALVDWRPTFTFARREAREMARYGGAIITTGLLGQLIANVDYLFVGAKLGAAALGFYWIAFRIPELAVLGLFQMAYRVLVPFYARLREGGDVPADVRELAPGYLETVRLSALVAFPAGLVLAALAVPATLVFFGEKWERSATPLALIAIWAAFSAVTGLPGTIFKAIGRGGLLTGTAVAYVVILVPALWIAAGIDIDAVAFAHVGAQLVYLLGLSVVIGRVLQFAWPRTFVHLAPGLITGLAAAAVAYPLSRALSPPLALALGPPAALAAYALALRLLFPPDFRRLVAVVRRLRRGADAAV